MDYKILSWSLHDPEDLIEAAARICEAPMDELQLVAGEMTPGERRTVRVISKMYARRIRDLKE